MALIIEDEKIKQLRKFAEENIITFNEFKRIFRKEEKCVGDRPKHIVYLPTKYRLVYSVEYCCTSDRKTKIKCKHMSLSALKKPEDNEQKYPNMQAVKLICELLGFSSFDSGKIQVDMRKDDPIPNIDVVEILSEMNMTEQDKIGF